MTFAKFFIVAFPTLGAARNFKLFIACSKRLHNIYLPYKTKCMMCGNSSVIYLNMYIYPPSSEYRINIISMCVSVLVHIYAAIRE